MATAAARLLCGSLPIIIVVLLCSSSSRPAKLQNAKLDTVKSAYDELYEDGKVAYADKRWADAIQYFEDAVKDYEAERDGMAKCYTECKGKAVGKSPPAPISPEHEDSKVIKSLAQQAECAEACKRRTVGPRGPVYYRVRQQFEIAYPFHYLQYAYYQLGNMTEGARAAITFALFNPNHEDTKANLELYNASPDVQGKEILPRMKATGRVLFTRAANVYHQKSYDVAIETMRHAVDQLFKECHICRSNCDAQAAIKPDEYGPEETEDSITAIVLGMQKKQVTCRLQCWVDMGSDFRTYHPLEMIPEAFNHIQYACHEVKEMKAAVQAAVDYLAIKPHDVIMKSNLRYYKGIGVDAEDFNASETVASMAALVTVDRDLLRQIKRSLPEEEEKEASPEALGQDDSRLMDIEKFFHTYETTPRKTEASESKSQAIYVMETPDDHNSLQRVMADGLASEKQCKAMLELAQKAKPGLGYGGELTGHADNELVEALNVSDAAEGAVKGGLNVNSVLMYLDLAEQSRKFVEGFFKVDNLHFSYSQLVCKTSLLKETAQGDKQDNATLSHPVQVHADNCVLKEDGRCVKESPAYTWRDYSAILHLNDDFTGGDFFFAHRQNHTVQHRVRPSCGRLVGFGADESNLHGVLPLQSGRRCVIALWMTLSPNMDEGNHTESIQKLEKLRNSRRRGDGESRAEL